MTRDAFLAQASVFQRPADLVKLLEMYRAGVSKDALYNDPANQCVFDAWDAAVFAVGYENCTHAPAQARLCHPEPFPDFQLRLASGTIDFETTLYTKKLLGREYKGDFTLGPPTVPRPETLPPFDAKPVTAAVAKKVAKGYGKGVHLCVHLNYSGSGANIEVVKQAVADGGGSAFESVWVLAGGFLGCAKASAQLTSPNDWVRIQIEDLNAPRA